MLKWTVRAVPTATDDVSALFAIYVRKMPICLSGKNGNQKNSGSKKKEVCLRETISSF